MPVLHWEPSLAVTVKEIDDQHKQLIELVNQLEDVMVAENGKEALSSALAELVTYTVYHFGTEERLMAQYDYELSALHKAEHKKLVEDIGAFKAEFDNGDAVISAGLVNFMRDWLTNHILFTDKKLGEALIEAGVK